MCCEVCFWFFFLLNVKFSEFFEVLVAFCVIRENDFESFSYFQIPTDQINTNTLEDFYLF